MSSAPPSTALSTCVVLCSYTFDRWDDLRAGLDALRSQSLPPDEIVLVIDHNTALRDQVEAARPRATSASGSRRPTSSPSWTTTRPRNRTGSPN
jgi:hypothetical protein